ncbi:hypothetical protein CRENBAI_004623 [Crenichthys baileyi]|uniref:Uncharacterized protein n=1 Tax=Crenichthys baileyi TaxID=28760 RepID=A0AAV9SFP0_9TELE
MESKPLAASRLGRTGSKTLMSSLGECRNEAHVIEPFCHSGSVPPLLSLSREAGNNKRHLRALRRERRRAEAQMNLTLTTPQISYTTLPVVSSRSSLMTAIVGYVSEGNDVEYREIIMDFVG